MSKKLAERQARNKLARYRPYPKQQKFHDLSATCKERLLRAGNQQGKTFAGAMEMAIHLTGRYPVWWQGRRFDHAIDAWAACDTGETTRDNPQRALLGSIGTEGQGAIPADAIKDIRPGRGVAGLADIVLVEHASGALSKLGFKRYDQGRQAWQGPAKHVIWCDEEPPSDIYGEALARLVATNGLIYTTFTPLRGKTALVERLMNAELGRTSADINMTLDEAEHILEADRAAIIAAFPEHEREARVRGVPIVGSGLIFPVKESEVACAPFDIPLHWPQLGGMDFGWQHPFAAVRVAWDRDMDCIYVTETYRVRQLTPRDHVEALRTWSPNLLWVWPHDGLNTERGSGRSLSQAYTDAGLILVPTHATHVSGGNHVEPGLIEMLDRMRTNRFKVFAHLTDWFDEFRNYHRDKGRIVKLNDDLLDATRMTIMMLRYAGSPHARPSPGPAYANDESTANL